MASFSDTAFDQNAFSATAFDFGVQPVPTTTARGGDDVPRRKSPHRGFRLEEWKKRQHDFSETIRDAYDELIHGPRKVEAEMIVAPHVKTTAKDLQAMFKPDGIDWAAMNRDGEAVRKMIELHEREMDEEDAEILLLH